jgi:uncharacterized protein
MDFKFMLGWINLFGLGVKKDYKKAAEWFIQSSNYPLRSYHLGILYLDGKGFPKNKKKAMRFIQNAVDMKVPQAKELLESLNKSKKIK